MKVFFDVTCLMPQRLSGVGVYARELFLALQGQGVDIEPVTKLSRILKPSAVQRHIHRKARPFLGPFEGRGNRTIVQGPDFKLLSGASRFCKIVTIHDLAVFHEGFNEEAFRRHGQATTRSVLEELQPDCIIADTHFIAREIGDRFPEFKNRVQCISPGSDHLVRAQNGFLPITKKVPFFLYAGHLETRKNIIGIVKGFEQISVRHPQARLVLVGKDGYQSQEIRDYISSSRARDAVELRGYVTESELQNLYASATAFVFPSFYEGFGFPILEAMSLGCPVITSDRGAMAELSGDAALLVNPHNSEQIGAAMEQLLREPSLVDSLMDRGYSRFKQFTWQKCAHGFVDLYKNL